MAILYFLRWVLALGIALLIIWLVVRALRTKNKPDEERKGYGYNDREPDNVSDTVRRERERRERERQRDAGKDVDTPPSL